MRASNGLTKVASKCADEVARREGAEFLDGDVHMISADAGPAAVQPEGMGVLVHVAELQSVPWQLVTVSATQLYCTVLAGVVWKQKPDCRATTVALPEHVDDAGYAYATPKLGRWAMSTVVLQVTMM